MVLWGRKSLVAAYTSHSDGIRWIWKWISPKFEYSGSSHQQPQGDSGSNTSPLLSDFELSQFEASEDELQDPKSKGGEKYCESEQGEIEVWDESEDSTHDTSDDDYFTQESPPAVSPANDGNEMYKSDRSASDMVDLFPAQLHEQTWDRLHLVWQYSISLMV